MSDYVINAYAHGGLKSTTFLAGRVQALRGTATKEAIDNYIADGLFNETGINLTNSGGTDVMNVVPYITGSLAGQGSGGASNILESYIVPGYLLANAYGFKLYFNGGAYNFQHHSVYIGEADLGGDPGDCINGTMQQVLFGGAANAGLIPPNSGVFASDFTAYNFDPTKTYVIRQGLTTATNFGAAIANSPIVNWRVAGAANAGTPNIAAGSSQSTARYFLDKMEIFTKGITYDAANDRYAGTYATIFNRGLLASAQGTGNSNYCYLNIVSAAGLAASANKLKLVLDGPTSATEVVASMRFGRVASSGDVYDFQTGGGLDNVAVNISGATNPTLNAATQYTTDGFAYPLNNGFNHIFCHDITSGNIGRTGVKTPNMQDYYKSGITPGSEAAVANKASYTILSGYNTILARILGLCELDLETIAYTAAAAPTRMKILVVYEAVDSITLNTDMTARVSRNNASNFTAVTLTSAGSYPGGGGLIMAEGEVDVSAQPSGTQLVFNVQGANGKEVRIYGIAGTWL